MITENNKGTTREHHHLLSFIIENPAACLPSSLQPVLSAQTHYSKLFLYHLPQLQTSTGSAYSHKEDSGERLKG